MDRQNADQLHDQPAESEPVDDTDQLYDQPTESDSASQTATHEGGAENPQGDISAPTQVDTEDGESGDSLHYPEGEIESAGDGQLPIEDHPRT